MEETYHETYTEDQHDDKIVQEIDIVDVTPETGDEKEKHPEELIVPELDEKDIVVPPVPEKKERNGSKEDPAGKIGISALAFRPPNIVPIRVLPLSRISAVPTLS
ncbi:hypothetical protein Sjap_017454 [Stephania japonica]|uniref:Uncharacterized protein n=1 Tax=Stephania japonica TaxID=461633 RepID=A0AAP0I670_9MAGN